jgi:hypothetical protein
MSEPTSVGGNATTLSGIVGPLLAKRFPPSARQRPADQRRRENGFELSTRRSRGKTRQCTPPPGRKLQLSRAGNPSAPKPLQDDGHNPLFGSSFRHRRSRTICGFQSSTGGGRRAELSAMRARKHKTVRNPLMTVMGMVEWSPNVRHENLRCGPAGPPACPHRSPASVVITPVIHSSASFSYPMPAH